MEENKITQHCLSLFINMNIQNVLIRSKKYPTIYQDEKVIVDFIESTKILFSFHNTNKFFT